MRPTSRSSAPRRARRTPASFAWTGIESRELTFRLPGFRERDAHCGVAVALADPVHRAVEPLAVVEEAELLVGGAEVRETNAEQADGRAPFARAFEEVADHRVKLELAGSGAPMTPPSVMSPIA